MINDLFAAHRVLGKIGDTDRRAVAKLAISIAGSYWPSNQTGSNAELKKILKIAEAALSSPLTCQEEPEVAALWGTMSFNNPDPVTTMWSNPDAHLSLEQHRNTSRRYQFSEFFVSQARCDSTSHAERESLSRLLRAINLGMARSAIQARQPQEAMRLIDDSQNMEGISEDVLCTGSELALDGMYRLYFDPGTGNNRAIQCYEQALTFFEKHFAGRLHHLPASICLRLAQLNPRGKSRNHWVDFADATFARSAITASWIARIPDQNRPKRRSA